MRELTQKIENIDAATIEAEINANGYAIISKLLSDDDCAALQNRYDDSTLYRKTVVMARHRFGLGEYRYFDYPLPDLIQTLRNLIYSKLAPIANAWFQSLNIQAEFPQSHSEFLQVCHAQDQRKPTPLILKYGPGGFNTLHQDLYGDIYFPMQMVIVLNEPGKEFTGGEFVLTKQNPRAQSKAIVLNPGKGDAVIFTTNFKSEKGTRGYYRVNIKHGVSEVKSGERHTVGIIFHDAKS